MNGSPAGVAAPGGRRIPHERAWNVALRTVHLMAFGLLLGGHAWEVDPARLVLVLWVTVLSGAGLMGLELYQSVHWLFLGKGLMVLAKLALLSSIPLFWEARLPLLLLVVAMASVGAHMPARFRHYSVLQRRVLLPEPTSPSEEERARVKVVAIDVVSRPESLRTERWDR